MLKTSIDFGIGHVWVLIDPNSVKITKYFVSLNTVLSIKEITFLDHFIELKSAAATKLSLPIKVYRNENVIFEGKVLLNGKFDNYQKECTLPTELSDNAIISVISRNSDNEYNLLAGEKVVSGFSYTTISYLAFQTSLLPPIVPSGFINAGLVGAVSVPTYRAGDFYTSGRPQKVGGVNSYVSYGGDIWYAIGSGSLSAPMTGDPNWEKVTSVQVYKFVKQVSEISTISGFELGEVDLDFYSPVFYSEIDLNKSYFTKADATPTVYAPLFNNGHELGTVLKGFMEFMFANSGVTVPNIEILNDASPNFFAKNLVGTDYKYLHIHDKSNVKYCQDTTSKNLYEYMTFKRFTEILKSIFNFEWRINENGYFQLIHPNDGLFSGTFDIRKFQIENISEPQIPELKSETWNFDTTNDPRFDVLKIQYGNSGEDKPYSLTAVCNNVYELLNGDLSKASNSGICFIPVNEFDVANFSPMQTDNLLTNFLSVDRPLPVDMNGNIFEIGRGERTLEFEKISAGDVENFNMYQFVKTLQKTHCFIESVSQTGNNKLINIVLYV